MSWFLVRLVGLASMILGLLLPAAAQDVAVASSSLQLEQATGDRSLLATPARLRTENVPLAEALVELRRTSGVALAFSPSFLPENHEVSCGCATVSLATALDRLLERTSLSYVVVKGQVLIEPVRGDLVDTRTHPIVHLARSQAPAHRHRLPSRSMGRQGTVTGLVVDARSSRPLPGVQVYVAEQEIGTFTNSAGQYVLSDVPAGQTLIRVQLIGYATMEQSVTVVADETVIADFELVQEALALDQLVVTGTPGGTRRRAIGNVVERVDAPAILEQSPAFDFQQLLGQRNPGVHVTASQGQVGAGGTIRIRGISSRSQSNEPIIYIDGVRVSSEVSGPTRGAGSRSAGVSRLNDINPEDIESMEVIKGPAAATLYGTEASAGVIQIITKRGSEGAPSFDFSVRQGTNWLQRPVERLGQQYSTDPETGELISFNLYEHEKEQGLGPVFQYGHLQSYTASVRGGAGSSRYYVSADWDDNVGIVSYNWQKRFNTRANVGFVPHENLSIDVNTGFTRGSLSVAQQQGGWDIWSNLLWGSPRQLDDENSALPLRGFLRATPEAIADIEAKQDLNRVISGATVEFRPYSWLTQRAVVGLDVAEERNVTFFPRHQMGADWYFGASSLGRKTVDNIRRTVTTVDYAATGTFNLLPDISSATSFGFQYYGSRTQQSVSIGEVFPAPGLNSVSAAATTSAGESFTENATAGVYLQQQFDWQNRLFLTGAVRGDDNSAFGAEFDAAIYPKLSATWVLHEEAFWNVPMLSSFRLRSAWGVSGQQPGTFDAIQLYESITGYDDGPGLTPGNFGNPQLKPERGEELEVGFDAGIWDGRVELVYTYYNRTTKDAILSRGLPPSTGFSGSQVINVGETKSWGHELGLDARVLQDGSRITGLDLGINFTALGNEITDMGGLDTPTLRAGYPIAQQWWFMVLDADIDDSGVTSNHMCDGGAGPRGTDPGGPPVPCGPGGADAPLLYWGQYQPTWELSANAVLTLYRNLRLYAQIDAMGGHMGSNNDITSSHTSYQNTSMSNLQDHPVFQSYRVLGRDPLRWYDGQFWKLREVSATYVLPSALVERFSASRASISLAARNLWTLKAQKRVTVPHIGEIPDPQIWDTEMGRVQGQNLPGNIQSTIPPLAQLVATLRFSF